MSKIICFDLEGPLSPQDNAYEIMSLIKDGDKIFEVLSKYDDILTIEKRQDYEPGDTLSLILPFLANNGISEKDIKKVSDKAKIVDGVEYTVKKLNSMGYDIFIISTSYKTHAHNIGKKIGVEKANIYCTDIEIPEKLSKKESDLIKGFETKIVKELYPKLNDSMLIKNTLDQFFNKEISNTKIYDIIKKVKVVGGIRKLNSVREISKKTNTSLDNIIAVGDSITDFKMLNYVRLNGGLAVVFNGNKYAIPHASVGLACSNMIPFLLIAGSFSEKGGVSAINIVTAWEYNRESFVGNPETVPKEFITEDVKNLLIEKHTADDFIPPYFNYLIGIDNDSMKEIIEIHEVARKFVRGRAAKLG